jgi:SAM-dependent methyltransferase
VESIREYTDRNRRAWNEIARVRAAKWPAADFFARGGSILEAPVLAAAPDVAGRRLLHLQCATGEDTLSWAVAGARATGVDISVPQIEVARRKATDAGLSVEFVASDVYDLPGHLRQGSFDSVYTGGGALVWLPDLSRWARVVASALRPGGRLLLYDGHPIAGCLGVEDGQLRIEDDYFARGQPIYGQGWRHFEGGENATETKVEFAWTMGDIVTSIARGGLRVESLEEFPAHIEWRFGNRTQEARRLPGAFLLIASKEA